MAWDQMKFDAALANKLKNNDIRSQVEGFNANTQRMQAATQADLLPSQQATHLAAAQAGLMNAGSNRLQIAGQNPMGFSAPQVNSMGLRGLGVQSTPQATQYGLQMYGAPGEQNPAASIAQDVMRRYQPPGTPDPNSGMPKPTTYNDIIGANQKPDPNKNPYLPNLARGGVIGNVNGDNGKDTEHVMTRKGEYFIDPTAVSEGFGGGDYNQGVRNLNRIIADATGYQPGPTYAKKGRAGFERSGTKSAKKKQAPREMTDAEWNEAQRTSWTPGMPPAMPVTDPQWNATQRGGREPLRSGTPPGPGIAQWNAMAGGVRGYPKQPGEDWAETTFGRAPTAAVPQTPRGQHYQSMLRDAPAVPLMSTAEQLQAQFAPPPMPTQESLGLPTTATADDILGDPNRVMALDAGDTAAVQRTAAAPRPPVQKPQDWSKALMPNTSTLAQQLMGQAAPTPPLKDIAAQEVANPANYAPSMQHFDEVAAPWSVRDKIQSRGAPGEQVSLSYGGGYGMKPEDRIYAQANQAGRFDSFSDRPMKPTLRMKHGGAVPGFAASGANLPALIPGREAELLDQPRRVQAAIERAAQEKAAVESARAAAEMKTIEANAGYERAAWDKTARAAEEAKGAEAAMRAGRYGPAGSTGSIPTGMNAPPPPGGPPPALSPWRAAISGGNTTPVSQALGQTVKAGVNAVKAVAPAAGQVLRGGALYAPGEGLWQGLKGSWTTPIEDYAKRGGFEQGEEGTVGGELKNIGIRAAGVGSDIGRGTLNALALPANLLNHGLDTKKWWDYGEENFADVKDKMWEGRKWDELMARKAKLEATGGKPQLADPAGFAPKPGTSSNRPEAAQAPRPSLRDVVLARALALGGGGPGAMDEQKNLLGYLGQTEQKQTDPTSAALAAAKFNAEHEKEIEASLLPRFKKTVTDDKGNDKEVDDREKFSRFVADVSGQGYNLYQMSRKDRDHLIDEWNSRDFTEGNVRKLAAASGDPNVALSQRLQPGRLRQGLNLSDVIDSSNINMWDYIKSIPGSGVRNQVYEQPSVDAATGKPTLQTFPGTVFENPNGTLNYDAWRYANQPKK